MIPALVCLAVTALLFGVAWALLAAGLRAGDRLGDTALTAVEPDGRGRGVWITVHNAGHHAVLLGAWIRRRSVRLSCEAGEFVSVPRRASRPPQRHSIVVVAARETQSALIPASAITRPRAELVLAVGEPDRLRVIHRAVELSQARPAPRRATARR